MPRSLHTARLLEPRAVGFLVEAGGAGAVDQSRIRRRAGVRMHCLRWIDEHARDIAPVAQDAQRILRHVLQGVGFTRPQRVAHARLHVTPPAVIGAAEPHQVRAAGVIARKPDRCITASVPDMWNDTSSRPRDLPQPLDVIGDDG